MTRVAHHMIRLLALLLALIFFAISNSQLRDTVVKQWLAMTNLQEADEKLKASTDELLKACHPL